MDPATDAHAHPHGLPSTRDVVAPAPVDRAVTADGAVRHPPAGRLAGWATDGSAQLSADRLHAVVADEDLLLLPGGARP